MIPAAARDGFDYAYEQQPTRTYRLHMEKGTFGGFCEGKEAMEQAVYKCLLTERYDYPIYSWNYGVELQSLYGQPIPYVYSELKRRIAEALMQDERISEVRDFSFSHSRGQVQASFLVVSTEGEFAVQKEVAV